MSGALNAEQLTWRLLCLVRRRTNTLLEKVAAAVEQSAFYSALWGSILTSPAVRLPGVSFVLLHLNRKLSMEDQLYVMGNDIELMVFDSMLPNNINNNAFLFNLKYCRIKRCTVLLPLGVPSVWPYWMMMSLGSEQVEAVSTSVQDSSVLVQRSTLDLILFCFPFHMSQVHKKPIYNKPWIIIKMYCIRYLYISWCKHWCARSVWICMNTVWW